MGRCLKDMRRLVSRPPHTGQRQHREAGEPASVWYRCTVFLFKDGRKRSKNGVMNTHARERAHAYFNDKIKA